MTEIAIVAALAVITLGLVYKTLDMVGVWSTLAALVRGRPPFARRAVMTDNEREFYGRLRQALPNMDIWPQVAMSAVVTTRQGLSPRDRFSARGRFSQKVIDYVVADSTGAVVVLVELDDRTHDKERDRARDAITGAAGYRTVRFPSRPRPTAPQIRNTIMSLTAPEMHP